MKFYITEETRQDLEIKLVKIDLDIQAQKSFEFPVDYVLGELEGEKRTIQQILSSSTILPVEKSWYGTLQFWSEDVLEKYPKGVIIKSQI